MNFLSNKQNGKQTKAETQPSWRKYSEKLLAYFYVNLRSAHLPNQIQILRHSN